MDWFQLEILCTDWLLVMHVITYILLNVPAWGKAVDGRKWVEGEKVDGD